MAIKLLGLAYARKHVELVSVIGGIVGHEFGDLE
jgi:hypothetical protein